MIRNINKMGVEMGKYKGEMENDVSSLQIDIKCLL